MTKGPPSCPTIIIVEAINWQSLKVFPNKPPEDEGVMHVIVECWAKNESQWKWKQSEVDKDNEHTITTLSFEKKYT